MEKNTKKECVCVCMNCFALNLNLTPQCKLIILKFKKKRFIKGGLSLEACLCNSKSTVNANPVSNTCWIRLRWSRVLGPHLARGCGGLGGGGALFIPLGHAVRRGSIIYQAPAWVASQRGFVFPA